MMMVKKTSPSRRVAAIAIPVAAVAALFALSQPAVADVSNRISAATMTDISGSKVNESAAIMQTSAAVRQDSPVALDVPEASAMSQDADLEASVDESALTDDASAAEDKGEKTPVYFVNDKPFEGNINDISPNSIESMDVVKNDPAYPQGKVMIYLKGYAKKAARPAAVAEVLPEFDGGIEALMQFLVENIKFPAVAKLPEKPVRVIVQFTICADGSLDDVHVVRSQGEAYDNEAIRVVRLSSGKWIPGENDGKPVATKFTLPITFSATSDSK